MKSISNKNKNKGFTIVELIVVMAIIAILILIAVPTFTKYIERANKTSEMANADTIYKASVASLISDYTATSKVTGLTSGQELPAAYQQDINDRIDGKANVVAYTYTTVTNIGPLYITFSNPTDYNSSNWFVYVKQTSTGSIDINSDIYIIAPPTGTAFRKVYKNGDVYGNYEYVQAVDA